MSFFDNVRAAFRANLAVAEARTQGLPTSSNGASSMHLHWRDLPEQCLAVEVDLEVRGTPPTSHLRFWALQASFVDGGRTNGAGHLGLQWIDGYPGHTAVNWGGYRTGGGELAGTESVLPSARGNVNTRDYRWTPNQVYGLRIDNVNIDNVNIGNVNIDNVNIDNSADGSRPEASRSTRWRGSVIDRATGDVTVVRELECPGTYLNHIVMWSELFSPCNAPLLTVEWSNATAFTSTGAHPISRFSVSYQTVADGGCSNTDVSVGPRGVTQTSNVDRRTPPGSTVGAAPER